MESKWFVKREAYSGERFDRAQQLAQILTDEDRQAGRPAPQYGYSAERFAEAERIVWGK